MSTPLFVAAVGGLALLAGLISGKLQDWPVSGPMLALLLGIALGPVGVGAVDLDSRDARALLATAAEALLAISLMGVALRFPYDKVRAVAGPILLLVTLVMVVMTAVMAAVTGPLLGVAAGHAVLLGAIFAPTDPVLASGVVGGRAERQLPERIRVILSVESGANDGLAMPLVEVGIGLVVAGAMLPGLGRGLTGVLVGLVVGGALGTATGHLLRRAEQAHHIEQTAFLVLSLALAACAFGTAEAFGGSTLVAVFVAGMAYGRLVTSEDRHQEADVDEAANFYLILPLFALLGACLPWAGWARIGWPLVALAVFVVLVRRLPLVVALARPLGVELRDAVFLGFFGPVGVAALAYLADAGERGAVTDDVWAAGTFVIATSTVLYGMTSAYGRRLHVWAARRAHPTGQARQR
ncbi:MAG: cation:proton antiporter [Euzebyales bacterium]|nr:cation:proton antiporter [Euzebyales bacterium]